MQSGFGRQGYAYLLLTYNDRGVEHLFKFILIMKHAITQLKIFWTKL